MTESPRPTLIITTPARDLAEFRRVAEIAVPLKRHGRVEVNVGALAGKSFHEAPEGGSPWHEYAALNPTLEKFVPHPAIAPHLPAEFIARNRELLVAKVGVLRELGLGAAFWNYLPNFLPEPFFEQHPHLRGPRTDHPRRSSREAFALCVDHPESLDMLRWMVRELVTLAPEIGTFYFKTNDAGPGLCWSHWAYSGANGPSPCRRRGMGERVRGMIEAVQAGAAGPLSVYFSGNFADHELDDIAARLPEGAAVRGRGSSPLTVSSLADTCYPVRGIFDPLGVLESLQPLRKRTPPAIFIDFRTFYDRGQERADVAERIVALVDDFLAEPAWGTRAVLDRLHRWCLAWAGGDATRAEALLEAFVTLRQTLKQRAAALPGISTIYGGVSMRYITRPLLFSPERLSPEDEAYFLPHVFNVSRERARLDYLDQHGSRLQPAAVNDLGRDPRLWPMYGITGQFCSLADTFASFADAPLGGLLGRAAHALRIYASVLRSGAALYAAQVLRDRFAASPPASPADPWTGHPDLLVFQELMREELDNATELQRLLEADGGMDLIAHADATVPEDTFLLGSDLPAQLARKQRLMRRHWLDAQISLPPPNR